MISGGCFASSIAIVKKCRSYHSHSYLFDIAFDPFYYNYRYTIHPFCSAARQVSVVLAVLIRNISLEILLAF